MDLDDLCFDRILGCSFLRILEISGLFIGANLFSFPCVMTRRSSTLQRVVVHFEYLDQKIVNILVGLLG